MKTKIITESEVPEILGDALPDINYELEKLASTKNIYKTVACFVDYTKELLLTGKMKSVKKCLKLAEKMLNEGNNTVKNAIENVYVYSLGTLLDVSDATSTELKKIFNGGLRKEYHRQIMASGK